MKPEMGYGLPDPAEVATILRRALSVLAAMAVANSAVNLFTAPSWVAQGIYAFLGVALAMSAVALKRGYVRPVAIGLMLAIFAAVTVAVSVYGGLRSGNALNSYLVVIVLAGLVWSVRAGVGFAIAASAVTLLIGVVDSQALLPTVLSLEEQAAPAIWVGFTINLCLTALILQLAVTRLRRTAKDARISEQRLTAVVEGAPAGIIVADQAGNVISANPAVGDLVGLNGGALAGRDLTEALQLEQDSASGLRSDLGEAVNFPASTTTRELEIGSGAAGRLVEASLSPFESGDGSPAVLVMLHDLTDRRNAERERASLEERLRASEKMEAIGMLAGGVAHDFNNLLTVILGNTDELIEGLDDKSNLSESASIIREAGERAAELTRQLLTFGRRQPAHAMVLDFNDRVREMERMLTRLIGANIELIVDLSSQPLYVRADPVHIEQVIANLIVNARDVMPNGGRITMVTQRVVLGYSELPPGLTPGAYMSFQVTDTGPGIPPAIQDRVFDPFFTTKDVGEGTGLGLSTVHGIVREANGEIRLLSEPDSGARIEILLPEAEPEVQPEVPPKDDTPVALASPITESVSATILVVEDQDAVRTLFVRALESEGYRVAQARNGEAAMALLESLDGDVDAVLTDVNMPRMGGVELVERLQERWPKIRALLMSGNPGSAPQSEGRPNVEALTKPFRTFDLLERVRRLLVEDAPG